jgi:hypothetical protein
VLRPFPLKDENGVFVGVCLKTDSGKQVVAKACGRTNSMETLVKEAAMNELLDKNAPETTKMILFKPA